LNRSLLLPSVYIVDQIAGDPEWLPHPVRLMGLAITKGEAALRNPNQSDADELIAGAALTTTLVAATYFLTRQIIQQAHRHSKTLGWLIEIGLGWTCLAARNLQQEAIAVIEALESNDIVLARRLLSRIVGRDTQNLDPQEISRALIETVAESASDGIIAPLFFMTLGGVPLAMAYKAINTLDSMIGHADTRYFYFGKAAARLDDAANYLPARLTASGIVAAASNDAETSGEDAWRIWLRDGNKHKSLNAGHPESAMAGALQVRLGGDSTYDGELIQSPHMGHEFPLPRPEHARKAIRLVSVVTLAGIGAGMLLGAIAQFRRAK
jgi:adenosylcobinamide-phosphate synthase